MIDVLSKWNCKVTLFFPFVQLYLELIFIIITIAVLDVIFSLALRLIIVKK